MNTTYGSVCSGIEAASIAWEELEFAPAWFSEIEAFPKRVLQHHWPHVPNFGDMTTLAPLVRCGLLIAPDILVGGTPCQSFSMAGLREGLSDLRGQLTLSYVELANAIDYQRTKAGKPPAIAVWENVPGVLSSRDNAFGCFLGALAGEEEPLVPAGKKWTNSGVVFGPKRTVAWRILDAQYFGLAQRRRRVFVVASANPRVNPAAILFEFEGVRRDSPPSRREAQEVTGTITAGAFSGGAGGRPEGAASGHFVPVTCMAHGQGGAEVSVDRSPTLTCNHEAPIAAYSVDADMAVRRLLPIECERLQGFPDGHTAIPIKKSIAPDGPRYKSLGNSMSTAVMRWIGVRIKRELAGCPL